MDKKKRIVELKNTIELVGEKIKVDEILLVERKDDLKDLKRELKELS